jgi:PEGA domain
LRKLSYSVMFLLICSCSSKNSEKKELKTDKKTETNKTAKTNKTKIKNTKDLKKIDKDLKKLKNPKNNIKKDDYIPDPPKKLEKIKCNQGENSITLITHPLNCNVDINGINSGNTPVVLCLKSKKKYEILIKKDGYFSKMIRIKRLSRNAEIFKQLKYYPWIIKISSKPNAGIYIDGRFVGRSNKKEKYKNPQKLWKVRVKTKGYLPVKFKVLKNDPLWKKVGKSYLFEKSVKLEKINK